MPYTPPVTSPALSPSSSNPSKGWPFSSISSIKKYGNLDNFMSEIDRDNALREVKDILSTSPQLSTSPRRKSAPESYSRKPSLKVDLPTLPFPEIPCILRKKSGEIVKSSLKKGFSKSEPVTPTFPKYVHFNADLEQIKLFNEAQRPQAVSVDASSDEDSDDDDNVFDDNMLGYSASDDEEDNNEDPELIISLPNRPVITTLHSSKPVFVESIYLSQDKRNLQGKIMVQNIAFQKNVEIRYTFDFWSTVSEVPATFVEGGVSSKDNKNSFDAFIFSIELIDNSRNPIDGKTMYFAVHYSVENNDFWDNNNGSNYQVNFKRVTQPSTSKYSNKKNKNNQNISSTSSKWSMASMSRQSSKNLNESLCRSPPTLETPKLNMDDVRKRMMGRYDIGVSLTAAQNAQRSSAPVTPTNDYPRTFQYFAPQVQYSNYNNNYSNEAFQTFFPNNYVDGMPGTSDFPISRTSGFEQLNNSNPIAIPSKPDIGSSSYYDLVNQYCFYSGSPYTANSSLTAGSPPVMT